MKIHTYYFMAEKVRYERVSNRFRCINRVRDVKDRKREIVCFVKVFGNK